uniref:Uncharacterized protein n=1 Tax=Oryza glumipatula TaxID=40148 RepID=A0A0E0BGM2_9ORYZ
MAGAEHRATPVAYGWLSTPELGWHLEYQPFLELNHLPDLKLLAPLITQKSRTMDDNLTRNSAEYDSFIHPADQKSRLRQIIRNILSNSTINVVKREATELPWKTERERALKVPKCPWYCSSSYSFRLCRVARVSLPSPSTSSSPPSSFVPNQWKAMVPPTREWRPLLVARLVAPSSPAGGPLVRQHPLIHWFALSVKPFGFIGSLLRPLSFVDSLRTHRRFCGSPLLTPHAPHAHPKSGMTSDGNGDGAAAVVVALGISDGGNDWASLRRNLPLRRMLVSKGKATMHGRRRRPSAILLRPSSRTTHVLLILDAAAVDVAEDSLVVALVRMLFGKGKAAMVADIMAEFEGDEQRQ